MKTSKEGINLIKNFEGLRLKAYYKCIVTSEEELLDLFHSSIKHFINHH